VKLYVTEYGVRGKDEHRVITTCEVILLAISLMSTNLKVSSQVVVVVVRRSVELSELVEVIES
jgi:hypothetical protein